MSCNLSKESEIFTIFPLHPYRTKQLSSASPLVLGAGTVAALTPKICGENSWGTEMYRDPKAPFLFCFKCLDFQPAPWLSPLQFSMQADRMYAAAALLR